MMRCGENNNHVHDSYEEEMAPSLDVNDTDEDTDEEKSNNSIVRDPFDKPSSDNLIMDVSESEYNLVNETDVPTNVITELKYDEHIEPSVSVKEESYFNIFVSASVSFTMLHSDSRMSIYIFSDEGL